MKYENMDLVDFEDFFPIITEKENWEKIFSDIFLDKKILKENLASIIELKSKLDKGSISLDELKNYSLLIYTIRNYFTSGNNIFLSYSTLDAEDFKISEVAARLEEFPKIDKVFYWEADSGINIVEYMEKTLKMIKVFVMFCSKNALNSKAVEGEWQAAYQMKKTGNIKIIPVYENENYIPLLLMPFLNVKYRKNNLNNFINELYDAIMRKS